MCGRLPRVGYWGGPRHFADRLGKPYLKWVIVCHCAAVNDAAVRAAYDAGARTVGAVCRNTGAGKDCGSCVFTVKRLVCQHEALAQSTPVEVEGAAS